MLQQQLQSQQLAEQAQKKPSRLGILRRNNRPPIQRPANFSLPTSTPPTTNSNQIFVSRSAVSAAPTPSTPTITQRNWKSKLRRGKSSRQGDLEAECGRDDDGFQVVSLDWNGDDITPWCTTILYLSQSPFLVKHSLLIISAFEQDLDTRWFTLKLQCGTYVPFSQHGGKLHTAVCI